jgi:hypothetical protein
MPSLAHNIVIGTTAYEHFLASVPKPSQHFTNQGSRDAAPTPARNDEHRLKLRRILREPADRSVSGSQRCRSDYPARILRVYSETGCPTAQVVFYAREELTQQGASYPEKLLWRRIDVVSIISESFSECLSERGEIPPSNGTDLPRRRHGPSFGYYPVMRSKRTNLRIGAHPDRVLVFPSGHPWKAPLFLLTHGNCESEARPDSRCLPGKMSGKDAVVVNYPVHRTPGRCLSRQHCSSIDSSRFGMVSLCYKRLRYC